MSVERFFLEGFRDEAEYERLKQSPAYPLVRELEFKFGLKVIRRTGLIRYEGPDLSDVWVMGHTNGIAVGKVFVSPASKNSGPDKANEYCYRSPYYSKERGSSREDKETIRSVKVSSLIATLTRHKVVPPPLEMEKRKVKQINIAMEQLKRGLGDSNKPNELHSNEIHALLLMALGKSPNSEWVKVDQNKCQIILDKYEEADRVRKVKAEESQRMFFNPFWMIGVDGFGDYIIGKYKLVKVADETIQYETVEPFKRYRSYESVPELVPLMTMVKVAYENEPHKAGVLPTTDKYDPNLDSVFFYNASTTHYDHVWMVTSCNT
jgi:hypothetical protein